jgi:hypothetical protein
MMEPYLVEAQLSVVAIQYVFLSTDFYINDIKSPEILVFSHSS